MAKRPHTAVIVEDEYLLAAELQSILEDFGFEVCKMAVTEEEAVEAILDYRPDLVTVDVKLRSGTGIEAVRRTADRHQACIVYVTADAHEVEAAVEGAICVSKPFDAAGISEAIKSGLADLPPRLMSRLSDKRDHRRA